MNSHGYSYLYWMYYGNMSHNFIHSINTSVTNTYNSVNYSSGSGSGGGFSGGGGFGGGGGRNGWTLGTMSQFVATLYCNITCNFRLLVLLLF